MNEQQAECARRFKNVCMLQKWDWGWWCLFMYLDVQCLRFMRTRQIQDGERGIVRFAMIASCAELVIGQGISKVNGDRLNIVDDELTLFVHTICSAATAINVLDFHDRPFASGLYGHPVNGSGTWVIAPEEDRR